MNGSTSRGRFWVFVRCRCVLVVALLGALGASVAPALAQTQVSGSGSSLGFQLTIAKPEGLSTPAYVVSSDCWYYRVSSDPDPQYTPVIPLNFGVTYQWGGSNGPTRDVIAANGQLGYSPAKAGYLWSFDLTPDALRGMGANSAVCLRERDGSLFSTKNAAPYLLGVTQVTVKDASGAPIPGAYVSLVNGLGTGSSGAPANSSGVVVMGQPLDGSSADCPYPPGLAADLYNWHITAPGKADLMAPAGQGASLASGAYAATMGASSSTIALAPSASSGSSCSPSDVTFPPADGGGGPGIPNWSDGNFPGTVQPTYLHSGPWSETVTVAVAGPYTLTGDCATASNIGTVTATVGGVAGTPVNCTTGSPGALVGASLGTFTLTAGANVINFTFTAGSFSAVKAVHLVPTSACGAAASSGSGSGDGSIVSFLSDFWDKLKAFFTDLFTLQQADVDALHTAGARLLTYGPLGVPAGLVAEVQNDFGPGYTGLSADASKPGYWVITLQPTDLVNATASQQALPSGYNPSTALVGPAHVSTIYDTMVPGSVDLLPYASLLLVGRRVALIALWLCVGIGLISRFTPQVRI